MQSEAVKVRRKRLAVKPQKIVAYVFLILLTVTFLFPYLWLIASSFKDAQGIFSPEFSLIPKDLYGNIKFVFKNYADAVSYLNLGDIFLNTLIVCVVNTVVNLILNAMAGYAFARIDFTGKEVVFKVVLTSMMIPGAVMMIPNLIIINTIGIYDTLAALILPFVMSIYNVFLLRQQFYALSKELEEAAFIDGAGRFRTFFVIALPLVAPMLVVLGITTFMWNYNNFLWPLVATQSSEVSTLARSLGSLVAAGRNNVNLYPVMLAGSVIVSAPLILIFFVLQKYIIGGIAVGGVKG